MRPSARTSPTLARSPLCLRRQVSPRQDLYLHTNQRLMLAEQVARSAGNFDHPTSIVFTLSRSQLTLAFHFSFFHIRSP